MSEQPDLDYSLKLVEDLRVWCENEIRYCAPNSGRGRTLRDLRRHLLPTKTATMCANLERGAAPLSQALKRRLLKVIKPYIVKRPRGGCQVLFSLTELDAIVERVCAKGVMGVLPQ